MKATPRLVVFIALWVISLGVVAAWAHGRSEDGTADRQIRKLKRGELIGPVIFGDNLGVKQLAGPFEDGKMHVALMVNVKGEWREAILDPANVLR